MLTDVEAHALAHLDETALVGDLVELVRIPSITGSDAESDLQHRQAAGLEELDLDVDTWALDLPALRADPRFPGTEADRTEGYGVVGTSGPGEPALILQSHVDVVPLGDRARWAGTEPFGGVIRGDVLHGRGACDMKAGVAVNTAVARTLHDSGLVLERPLAVHCVVSEEDGGLGAFATMVRGHGGAAAVITEPTSGRVVTAHAGALTFTLTVPGLAAHGSARASGVSAFDAFLPVHRAILELERERNADHDPRFGANLLPYPISIGRIAAGDWASSVPDLLTAEGRLGVRLGEDPADARASFARAVDAACRADPWLADHPVALVWSGGQFASGATPTGHPVIAEVTRAAGDVGVGHRDGEQAVPYGSDLRLYTGVGGIPTLLFGPGDVRMAHAPREQVSVAETLAVARAIVLLAVRRCGAHR
ncbi:M20/M25/M40 family metallo-hydrolase [Nakamurella flavida]|uniref:M20/M25/M40 family metallo-hydrolase n=1 Tax=Nakamurella flavida TaxID=363630 RepID=A0A938YK62_9ACTN|nr:M20/M25/M40 family metallo-hydrolase [Nakamurella flavida]MBM9476664.1 M20/M25/M40 family metallo-hydrolase [Nakamurella flavida]MDP9778898.1 acetylornithine deacetylase [Nakamurella flavida]